MVFKFTPFILTASMLLAVSVSSVAFADGMPFKEKKPEPIMTPLDKALEEIDTKEQPVDVKKVEEEPEEEPVVQEAKEEPEIAPVPESRVVEVQPNSSFFGLSVGLYDAFTHDEEATAFNFEWQPGVRIAGFIQPIFGAMMTTQGTMLGYGGVGVPFNLTDHIFMMPSVAVGAYEEGDGYDLDRTLAFRVGTEVAYQFENKSRIGLNAHVITNGRSTHREDRTEVLSLVYTTPMDILSGNNASEKAAAPAEETVDVDNEKSEKAISESTKGH